MTELVYSDDPISAPALERMIEQLVTDLLLLARTKPLTVRIVSNIAPYIASRHEDDGGGPGGETLDVHRIPNGTVDRSLWVEV